MTHHRSIGAAFLLLAIGLPEAKVAGAPQAPAAQMSLERLREVRKQLAHRSRRVIFNNDGCDCLYYPADLPVTAENFLRQRTTPLAGSQVDAIFYCTISSGFGFFTHDTKAGTLLTRAPADYDLGRDRRNISRDLIAQGRDCLRANIDFARRHGIECFWSMRMNDTHDAEHTPQKPYFLFPPLKAEHPDWLVGEHVKRTPFGRWSSVDYGRPEIRELAFRYLEEVCQGCDVDGIELDFFRHLCYFKSVAQGGKARPAECEAMTGLLQRVRAMSEQEGLRRGRPILVAVRVPDSVEFGRELGLDIDRWLREGLVDLLMTTCYFRLNPWSYSTHLGHQYGVPVYPCLSDSRVLGEDRFRRMSIASYRGRATNAWNAGADGIHIFNLFDPNSPVWRELGDARRLRGMSKIYFVTVRDGNPNAYLARGVQYRRVPILTPSQPGHVTPAQPLCVPIEIGDDPGWASELGRPPRVTCHLWLPRLQRAEDVTVSINGRALVSNKLAQGWLDCPVEPGAWKQGVNEVQLALRPASAPKDDLWSFEYVARRKPARPWTRDPGSVRTEEKLVDGGLLIADRGTQNGDYLYYRYPWGASPDSPLVIETRVKVVSGVNCVIFTDGSAQMRLELRPERVGLWKNAGRHYAMNTTDDFHLYRIETRGPDVKVFVDGKLRIDAPGVFRPTAASVANQLAFGAANSFDVGEACWSFVRARLANQVCQDVVVSVDW